MYGQQQQQQPGGYGQVPQQQRPPPPGVRPPPPAQQEAAYAHGGYSRETEAAQHQYQQQLYPQQQYQQAGAYGATYSPTQPQSQQSPYLSSSYSPIRSDVMTVPTPPNDAILGAPAAGYQYAAHPSPSAYQGYGMPPAAAPQTRGQHSPAPAPPSQQGRPPISAQGYSTSPAVRPPPASSSTSTWGSPGYADTAPYNNPFDAVASQRPIGYSSSGYTASSEPKADDPAQVLNLFDPLAKPKRVTVHVMDGPNVTARLDQFRAQGKLSEHEYQAIAAQAYRVPAKITLALDSLEESGDRSGIFELLIQPTAPRAPASSNAPFSSVPHVVPKPSQPAAKPKSSGGGLWGAVKNVAKGSADSSSDDDSDDGRDEETANDEQLAKLLQEQFDQEDAQLQSPHPAAGGFKESLPASFLLVNGELLGKVLVRVTSKKLFRKWKELFFSLNRDRLCLYESNIDYEAHRTPRIVYRFHSCMYIRKPTIKHTYSMMDDGERVYFTVFRENITEEGSSTTYTGLTTRQNSYSFDAKSHRICKFGSHDLRAISAFAHAIHGVILWKRREKSLQLTKDGQGEGARYD